MYGEEDGDTERVFEIGAWQSEVANQDPLHVTKATLKYSDKAS